MNNYLMFIEYDGSGFCGWQAQPGAKTVQSEIEKTANIVLNSSIKLVAAGRTDKGVHAFCQAANFLSEKKIEPSRLLIAFNSLLPRDIAVTSVKLVPLEFNARFDAAKKIYQYRIWNKACRSVWAQKVSWQIIKPLNVELMRKSAGHLEGRHNFSAFDAKGGTQKNKIVNLEKIKIRRSGGNIIITFTADRYLYKMVRNIVGTLVEAGLGRIKPSMVKNILDNRSRKMAGPTAPACGLFLKKVIYEGQ